MKAKFRIILQSLLRSQYPLPWLKAARIHFVALLVLLFLLPSLQENSFYKSLARPTMFAFRSWLGSLPKMDERLKIYVIDDATFEAQGNWVLSTAEWVKLLKAISANKPKAIFIDAIFSKIIGTPGPTAMPDQFPTPIYVGGYISESPIRFKVEYPLDSYDRAPGTLPENTRYFYSHHPDYLGLFSEPGQFMYEDDFTIWPMLNVRGHLIPHLGLKAAENLSLTAQNLLEVEHQSIRLHKNGSLTLNFIDPKTMAARSFSLLGILNKVRDEKPLNSIKEGDYVFIIPQFYTGNSDLRPSPFGLLPGGYVIASVINSYLTKQWIQSYLDLETLACIFAGILAFICVYHLSNLGYVLSLLLFSLVTTSLFLLGFALAGYEMPWIGPLTSFLLPSLSISLWQHRILEKRNDNLRMAFTGHVPPVILEKMMAAPTQHHSLETQERIITVVFIDLVGFSIFSSNMPPKMAFEHLKKVMQFITGLIHTHGGVVDRTLGDGLLCYFGHTFNKQATELNSGHADRAVQCCLQIQEQNIRQLVQGKDVNIVFPIRIGINTASCYIGNMGSSDRIDFTIVGNGVNFAKRLESCCTMNHILISESTYRYLHDLRLPKDAVAKRSIRIKHHDQEIQTFEINPVSDNPALLEYASRNFERLTKAELIIESWHVLDSRGIRVLVASKTAEITLLTKTYLHLKTFAAHSDGTIMLKIEDSKPSAPDRQLDGIQLSGTLQFLTDNPDKSRTYQFTPAPEAAPQMQQFSALFLKRAVVDSVTNSRHKGKLILFGARS